MQLRLRDLDKDAYTAATVSLDEQYSSGDPSLGQVIESTANWGVPSHLKASLGLLARNLVSHREQPVEYKQRCRALGLGAWAGLMLSERAEGSLSFLYGGFGGGLNYDMSSNLADQILDIAETTEISLGQMGDPARDWVKARAKDVGLPEREEFWFTVGASRGLDYMRLIREFSNK
jgi:hypothetical protein